MRGHLYIAWLQTWLLCLCCAVLAVSCSPSVAQQQQSADGPAQPLLLFQKTPCLGPCPAYNATIYSNGSVSFVPFKNALAQDTLLLQLSEQELQQLREQLTALDYSSLQSVYPTNWSDNSSTYLTFYRHGKEAKRVKHQEGGPPELLGFIKQVSTMLEARAKEKSMPTY